MSNFLQPAAFEVELFDVTFTEHVTVCEIASSDRFTDNLRGSGLKIIYCGPYILFQRDGWADEAVSFSLVKKMRTLSDVTNIAGRRAEIEAEKKAKAEAEKVIEFAQKKKVEEEYRLGKEAMIAAKQANPNFANSKPIDQRSIKTLELAAKAGYGLDAAHAIVARNEALDAELSEEEADQLANDALQTFRDLHPVVTPTVDPKEMIKDMRAERGTLSDEEERSMHAAVARSKKGRR